MSSIYDYPAYYEIAFSFRDIAAEVDVFEACFRRFSQIPVSSVLELACGNSPHLAELVKRGYEYRGLDLNPNMLEYSRAKASVHAERTDFIQGDMTNFTLNPQVDFVYTLLDSLFIKNAEELISHFDSVAEALRKGGLYLLDWCIKFPPPLEGEGSWVLERDGINVKTTVSWKSLNPVEQLFKETITLEVDEQGEKKNYAVECLRRAIYPQEFLGFISQRQQFEFIGWWNVWDLDQPLEQAVKIDRPITVLRRL